MKSTELKADGVPLIALTMGDPAGIGPEIIASGWPLFTPARDARFVVIGRVTSLERAARRVAPDLKVVRVESLADDRVVPDSEPMHCLEAGDREADEIVAGKPGRASGAAAFAFLDAAICGALAGEIDAIVTAPISKHALQQAGHAFPGHTEILARRCGVSTFAMMLYIPPGQQVGGEIGLGVAHVTLHQSLRGAIDSLTTPAIVAVIRLVDDFARKSLEHTGLNRAPRIAVAALNPHGGESGLFGDEESRIIQPAIDEANCLGISCTGPLPCDTLMARAASGEFDAVVAMYHDQGHIALKLLGMHKSVNVTLGLPIVRTSVAHGTAFEIAGTGQADHTSLLRAIDVAKTLTRR